MNPFRRRAAESKSRAFSSGPFRALALFVIFAVSSSLQATVYTWRPSPPNNDWNVSANWQGNVAPPSDLVNTDIVYNSSTATFPSLNSPYSVHSLTFNDGSNGYAFSGGQLTLGTGGITQNSTYEMAFGNVVALGAAQTWNLGAGTGALTLAGGLANSGFALTLNSLGTNNIIGGAITGTGSLTKNGTGNLTLTGASTYTGATVVGGGTLTIANGGSLTYSVNNVVGPGLSVGPGATLAIGSGGSVNYGPSMSTPGQSLAFNGISASPALGTLSTGGSLAARFLYLGTISGGYGTFTQTGGTLTTSDLGAFGLEVGNAGGSNGTYYLQGGSLTTYTSEVGASGTGLLAQTGGTHTVSQSLNVGASAGSNGTYTLGNSGAALSTRNTTIGLLGTGTFTQTGGTHTVSNILAIGDSAGNPAVNATGTYNLSGDGVLSTVTTVLARSGTGSFNQTGGSHTVSNQFVVGDGRTGLNPTGAASYNLSGGTLSTGAATIALSNTGTLTQTGGSFTTNFSDLFIGRNSDSNGTYNLSGTGTLTTQSIVIGYDGTGKFVQSGGSFLANGALVLGFFSGNGTYTLNGGSVTASHTTVSNNTNTSTFTQNGGTHTTGTLYLGAGSGSNATYDLNGGLLSATEVTRNGGAGTFNFNGGTLRASGFTASFFHGLTNANVFSGGARIDSNGLNITVDQSLQHASALGSSLDGGLIKSGSGTLTLTVPSTYTGGTTITGGTLSVANDLYLGAPTGPVTISNGAQLAFTSASILTGRTFNLSNGIVTPAPAGTISYQGATVNGGTLGAGNHTLLASASFNGTRATTGTVISQLPNTSAFNNVTLSRNSSLTQSTGATLNSTGDFIANPQTTMTINGTFNTTGGAISGALNINNGGQVNQSGSSTPLYLDGTRGTTVNLGGQLNAANGSSIELGGLLVNNGAQTGVLNVNLGGLAKGSGAFGTVNVNDGGRFSPGNSPGTATLGALSLSSGGRYEFELNSANAIAGHGADFINVLGNLDIAAGTTPGTVFTIALISLNSSNQPAALLDFDATQPYAFTIATAADGISGFMPNEFRVDPAGFANNLQGGSFAIAQNGNSLELQFHPVPEPSTWAMMLLGVALLIAVQQRRRI